MDQIVKKMTIRPQHQPPLEHQQLQLDELQLGQQDELVEYCLGSPFFKLK